MGTDEANPMIVVPPIASINGRRQARRREDASLPMSASQNGINSASVHQKYFKIHSGTNAFRLTLATSSSLQSCGANGTGLPSFDTKDCADNRKQIASGRTPISAPGSAIRQA
eukprot:TRINITY_DN20008_c0_g1_i1.p2 TRINITY_DN20008_c0_g1~~TRINITY_DN20008_c0_g1_i1.p2  ORF type:complete len:113 (+),score=9.98 TRINITY_DN20008_c0_g1_i1:296-634(+)